MTRHASCSIDLDENGGLLEPHTGQIRMYRPPETLTLDERDAEVRALLARGLLRVVLTRRTEKGGMALTGRRVRAMNVPPRPVGVNS